MSAVAFKEFPNSLPVGGPASGAEAVGGIGFCSQFEGRADGTKRDLHCSSADLMASAESSCACFCSKGAEELNLVDVREPFKKGVHVIGLDEVLPMLPIA